MFFHPSLCPIFIKRREFYHCRHATGMKMHQRVFHGNKSWQISLWAHILSLWRQKLTRQWWWKWLCEGREVWWKIERSLVEVGIEFWLSGIIASVH
jgi:hypothetical protein